MNTIPGPMVRLQPPPTEHGHLGPMAEDIPAQSTMPCSPTVVTEIGFGLLRCQSIGINEMKSGPSKVFICCLFPSISQTFIQQDRPKRGLPSTTHQVSRTIMHFATVTMLAFAASAMALVPRQANNAPHLCQSMANGLIRDIKYKCCPPGNTRNGCVIRECGPSRKKELTMQLLVHRHCLTLFSEQRRTSTRILAHMLS